MTFAIERGKKNCQERFSLRKRSTIQKKFLSVLWLAKIENGFVSSSFFSPWRFSNARLSTHALQHLTRSLKNTPLASLTSTFVSLSLSLFLLLSLLKHNSLTRWGQKGKREKKKRFSLPTQSSPFLVRVLRPVLLHLAQVLGPPFGPRGAHRAAARVRHHLELHPLLREVNDPKARRA